MTSLSEIFTAYFDLDSYSKRTLPGSGGIEVVVSKDGLRGEAVMEATEYVVALAACVELGLDIDPPPPLEGGQTAGSGPIGAHALLVGNNTFTGIQKLSMENVPLTTFAEAVGGAEGTIIDGVYDGDDKLVMGWVVGRVDLTAIGGGPDVADGYFVKADPTGGYTVEMSSHDSMTNAPVTAVVHVDDLKIIRFFDPGMSTLGRYQSADPVSPLDVANKGWVNSFTRARSIPGGYTAAVLMADPVEEPTLWVECGGDSGDDFAWWACPTVIPSPASTMTIRALARWHRTEINAPFCEFYSECLDGGVGNFDRFELAGWRRDANIWLFFEWTEVGADAEQWLAKQEGSPSFDPDLAATAAGVPPETWVETRVDMDFTAGTCTLRVRTDSVPTWVDPDDGSLWMTVAVYAVGAASSLEESNFTEQWIGRGAGRWDVGRVRRWDDGVLVMDFDPSATAAVDDTTVADSVLLDESDDPAVWTATVVVKVAANPLTAARAEVAAASDVAELAAATAAYLGML